MPAERIFVKKGIKRAELEEYLENELERAGYGGMDLRRTPAGTRVTIYVERPGIVIGRKGKSVQRLTEILAQKFGMENPQVEISDVKVPELNARIMARRVAFALSQGRYFRRVGYMMLRRIMQAGARGAEIVISGKLTGEHARSERFYDGYLKKAGEPASELVDVGYAVAKLKPGVLGVKVRIMPPDVKLPDEIKIGGEVSEEEGMKAGESKGESTAEEAEKEETLESAGGLPEEGVISEGSDKTTEDQVKREEGKSDGDT